MGCVQSEISPQNETPKKGCTDVLWLVIYILFWILMIIVAAISFVYGNPLRIINGFDSYGNTCGVKTNQKLTDFPLAGISTADKSYLFFMDIKHLRKSLKICVKKCPTRKLESLIDIQNFYKETDSVLCRYDIQVNKITNTSIFKTRGPCPTLPVYESFPILNRCFPKATKDVAQKVFSDFYDLLNSWDTIEQMLSDLYSSWKEIIICVIVAFILSLLMVSILHLLATFVSWIFMVVVCVVSVAGTALLWHTWHSLRAGHRLPDAPYLAESLKNETAFLWYSVIATIITVVLLLLVWVMRSRVSFLAALFKETAHCLGAVPALFLQPVVTFLLLALFFAFWSCVVVCLATANYPGVPYKSDEALRGDDAGAPPLDTDDSALMNVNATAKVKTYLLVPVEFDPLWIRSMWWVCLVCLVWGSEFILGCQQMTIAGAVSHWYFRGPNAHPSPVLYSIGKLVKYHLGSVAKGSFLITLFKIPRLIMTYLHAKLSSRAEKGSECAKCGLKCGICCFYCLEKFLRYLNHNAYTIITIERCHFCKAAAKAFNTIVNNALQVATINSVGDFILFLGKCIVTAGTGIVGLLLLRRNAELHFYAAPTLLVCVFAFFIAHCMLSLYEMVVDTLFICVCEDRNLNGDAGRWRSSRLAALGAGADPAEMSVLQDDK